MSDKKRYDRSDIRQLNTISVLDLLRKEGSLSRATIARHLGLTRATASKIAADLLDATLIQETDFDAKGTGRPGLLLTLNPDSGCMIGVDLDLDRITAVMANVGRKILWRGQIIFPVKSPPDFVLAKAKELVMQAMQAGQIENLKCYGICIALAGLVNRKDGCLEYGPTSGWTKLPLKSEWETFFKVPVYVENEAHVAAIGAHHFGYRPGVRNLIYLSLGVGLAAGVFVDSVLLRGKSGFAGQVGHTYFEDNGIICSCGKKGCWVTEIGATAIRKKLEAASVEFPADSTGVDWVPLIAEKATGGDTHIRQVIEGVAEQIGVGLSRLVQTFNPALVIVGGRMGPLLKPFESTITQAMLQDTLPSMSHPLELKVSDSTDDHLQGCLATVFDSIMKNPSVRRTNDHEMASVTNSW